jgi:hypothetical protein
MSSSELATQRNVQTSAAIESKELKVCPEEMINIFTA